MKRLIVAIVLFLLLGVTSADNEQFIASRDTPASITLEFPPSPSAEKVLPGLYTPIVPEFINPFSNSSSHYYRIDHLWKSHDRKRYHIRVSVPGPAPVGIILNLATAQNKRYLVVSLACTGIPNPTLPLHTPVAYTLGASIRCSRDAWLTDAPHSR
ncbi:hypothetical protein SeMB42_g07885 [Synchytrium endobioticum]|uniref:Uncharacterized protein n=1 Tax=Synchytrium endobioticum TaxID=286115 RepID=A0A507BTJ7_9FUNG|nr:hypothetical protein SeMB42_g07885 [Synchytrium endobioticum]